MFKMLRLDNLILSMYLQKTAMEANTFWKGYNF